ncbi:MAG TPA: MqnA/MqnD/SBP family protein [Planctomycetota bacterium]|nr:MqnA/MqnD/SBP family protein [Planctomycetota bacterium]
MSDVMEAPRVARLTLGHSPDADDAFMFYGLARRGVAPEIVFEHRIEDIESLNRRALAAELDVTAISVHALAFVAEKYALLRAGASVGEGYGPRVVARGKVALDDLAGARIAVPGALTTAALTLRLRLPAFEPIFVPFDRVFDAVESGAARAALVIHEGQLTFARRGFSLVEDLGAWWQKDTGLPLPLGVNVVRRDLGAKVARDVVSAMRRSIERGFAERDAALEHAAAFGRGVDRETLDRFVSWYVNPRTLDLGEDGLRAVRLLLERGAEKGIVPAVAPSLLEPIA